MSAHIEVDGDAQVELSPALPDTPACTMPRYDSINRTGKVPDFGLGTLAIRPQNSSVSAGEILIAEFGGAHPQTMVSVGDKVIEVVLYGDKVDASIEGLRETHVLNRGENTRLQIGTINVTITSGNSKSNARGYCSSHRR